MRKLLLAPVLLAALPLGGCIKFGAEPPPSLLKLEADAAMSVQDKAARLELINRKLAELQRATGAPVYARVDLIRDNDGALAVMELEMIEPELFFRFCPPAADKLAAGIARRLAA